MVDGGQRILDAPPLYHLAGSVGPLAMGRHDPCARFVGGTFWWAADTPEGPASLSLRRTRDAVVATAHGGGAAWVLDRADAIAGLRDDLTGFAALAAAHPLVARVAHQLQGRRLPATGRLFQRLVRTILEQKVTGTEAYRGYAATVRRFGGSAPGPLGKALRLPPRAADIAAAPYWVFHPFGIEQKRADTLRRAAVAAERLERCADAAEATTRLRAIVGIGPWTAAEVVRVAYGDPDAVSVGDFHIPHMVAWALAGEARGDDARMLALLEPFRGHRGRVCVLLEAAGIGAPRFGPRMPIRSFARF
ncbi:MAG TPA: DNA-3-methyladenine glycosylase 2 family protein [Asanoa sp.]